MTKRMILALLLTLCLAAPVAAQDNSVIVLLDLSGSTAHIISASFAAKAGAYVAREVAGLPLGSRVSLRTFGLADAKANGLALDYTLTKRLGSKPREVATKLSMVLAAVPKLAASGKLKVQDRSQIIRALYDLSSLVKGCDARLIIISDMLEYSPDANCYRLATYNSGGLPAPPAGLLAKARVAAVGCGYGLKTAAQSRRLQELWSRWFEQAGAAEFVAIPRL